MSKSSNVIPFNATSTITPVDVEAHEQQKVIYIATAMKSRGTAAMFALFLGGIGAHQFYIGNVGLGLVYALFFWTGIPAILGVLAALRFGMMSDATFNAKFNGVQSIDDEVKEKATKQFRIVIMVVLWAFLIAIISM